MVNSDGTHGFSELEIELNALEGKYKSRRDTLLNRLGNTAKEKTVKNTPVLHRTWAQRVKGQLKHSWELLPVKTYKSGKIAVVKIQSEENYAHLIEYGHEVFTARRKHLTTKIFRASKQSLKEARVKHHGYKNGYEMLKRSLLNVNYNFNLEVEKMIDDITKAVQV